MAIARRRQLEEKQCRAGRTGPGNSPINVKERHLRPQRRLRFPTYRLHVFGSG